MRLSLSFRVFVGFLIINLLYIAILIIAIVRLNEKSGVFSDVYLTLYKYVQRVESSRVLKHEELKRSLEIKHSDEKIKAIESYLHSFKNTNSELITRIKSLLNVLKRSLEDSGEGKSYQQLLDRISSIEQKSDHYIKSIEKLVDSINLGIYPGPIDYWVPVENAENILSREHKIFVMQVEGVMKLLINKMGSIEQEIKWQLIYFTILAFVISIGVLITLEKRIKRINRFSQTFNTMMLRGEYNPIRVAGDDEISDLINNINKLTTELIKTQKETETNRDQLISLTTNLRRINAELQFLKSYNESIINSIRIAILVLNEKLKIVKVNPALESLFKISDDCIDSYFFDTFKLFNTENIKNCINEALTNRKTTLLQEVSYNLSDREMILNIQISPFVGESEGLLGIVITMEDFTEVIRTKRLLLQSERLATIGRMAAQLTHQIKNPLSTISLNLELLQDDIEKEDIHKELTLKKIGVIKKEIEELINLSNEYLQFARISATDMEGIDINQLIDSIIDFYQIECKSRGIIVIKNTSKDIAQIKGNTAQLKQAIINIFVNAIDSVHENGKIVVSTEQKNGYIAIEISDNGKGIDESIIPYIFDPFYSSKESGYGLGLSISHQIIEQMGGRIECVNNKVGGATFIISLPI